VIGASRKRFLRRWQQLPEDADESVLDRATVDACVEAVTAGAKMLRVHNVALLRTALTAYNQ
jgi:dihydropteroate synthase